MSSLSDDMAIFSLAGAQAANSLALADCPASPSHGRSVEWEFEGIKVSGQLCNTKARAITIAMGENKWCFCRRSCRSPIGFH